MNTGRKFWMVLIAAVGLNAIAFYAPFRADITDDKRFTLSEPTKNLVDSLQAPLTVRLFFSDGLPPELQEMKESLVGTINDMGANARQTISIKVDNPNSSPENEAEAQKIGIQPQLLNIRERDREQQQRIYLGMQVLYQNRSKVVPIIYPADNKEYLLAKAISGLINPALPEIGIIGNSSVAFDMNLIPEVDAALKSDFKLVPIPPEMAANSLNRYKAMVWINPTDSFAPAFLLALDKYLQSGGNLLLAAAGAKADIEANLGTANTSNIFSWLEIKGIRIEKEFLIDASAGQVNVPQQADGLTYYINISFPLAPIISNFAGHPVVKGINACLLPFSSPLTVKQGMEVLARSSAKSGLLAPPIEFDMRTVWADSLFNRPSLPVAATITSQPGRLLVIGNGTFMQNQGDQPLGLDNLRLFTNSIEWLTDTYGLMEVKSKGIQARPLSIRNDNQASVIRWMNIILPAVLFLVAAGIIQMLRKRRRNVLIEKIIKGIEN